MDLYEYQNKRIFKENHLPVLKGGVAYTPQEAKQLVFDMGGDNWCVKAQVHGKSVKSGFFILPDGAKMSAIMCADNPADVADITYKMLNYPIILPPQKSPYRITRVYVEEKHTSTHRIAISFRIDMTQQSIILAVQARGKLKSYKLKYTTLSTFTMMRVLRYMNLSGQVAKRMHILLNRAYAMFLKYKAIAVELNPIIITNNNQLCIANGRIIFDNAALSFFPEIKALQEAQIGAEKKAAMQQYNIRYFSFSGNIACIVNGAGIGASTLDLVQSRGGKAACLFDIGAEPTTQTLSMAFKLALSEPNVEGVFINIFGGITRCDVLVQGLIAAAKEIALGIPMVVRIEGINAQVGIRLLFESNLPFTVLTSLHESVDSIIKQVQDLS